ncbi:mediator of RNA polymerase II transcription subunit 27-like [Lytechinus pictus]|uniref:mediator of RNA polymerase II transcription subunit 27-like n=1 Tax=Lytechinus pictus TaxID=7653 RepID=UPI00240D11CA|nr:mediator of RNA polymerase II transcription subunit 27-like [Lytechinus pictus]
MANPIVENANYLNRAILTTQKLRISVSKTFNHMKDGIKVSKDEHGAPKSFASQLQEDLFLINESFVELEKLTNAVRRQREAETIGNTGSLSMDPITDKTPLYPKALETYKWATRLREHSSFAHTFLNSSSIKRSSGSGGSPAKRRKTAPTNLNISTQAVDNLVMNVNRQFHEVKITKIQLNPTVLQVYVSRTLQAIIVLRGLLIERVLIRAHNENTLNDDGTLDLWTPSKYEVFQKITEHATAASLRYYLPTMQDLSFRSFMHWLNSFAKLFSTPCRLCGKYIKDNLPPTWRCFRTVEPYHECCRP